MNKKAELTTDRLLLRNFTLSDASRVKELAGDKDIADTTLNVPHPYEDGMAEQWISSLGPQIEAGLLANYAITLKNTGELIGAIGLTINKTANKAELAYWIGKNYWNKGYCTEASKVMLQYGFTELGLNKIFAVHMTRNPSSGMVMKKIGMKQEGFFPEDAVKCGKYEDMVRYGILKKDWEN